LTALKHLDNSFQLNTKDLTLVSDILVGRHAEARLIRILILILTKTKESCSATMGHSKISRKLELSYWVKTWNWIQRLILSSSLSWSQDNLNKNHLTHSSKLSKLSLGQSSMGKIWFFKWSLRIQVKINFFLSLGIYLAAFCLLWRKEMTDF